MSILLCSTDREIRKRWQDILIDEDVLHIGTISDLKRRVSEGDVSIILLHRSMVSVETIAEIHEVVSGCRIFLLSDRPDEEEGFSFLKQRIVGYANTYISPTRLNEAVHVILSGSVWLGQALMNHLIQETISGGEEKIAQPSHHELNSLTPREHEIAEMVAKGQSNLEVAFNLKISERTVKAHLSSIYAKTKTGNRLNLALLVNQGKK